MYNQDKTCQLQRIPETQNREQLRGSNDHHTYVHVIQVNVTVDPAGRLTLLDTWHILFDEGSITMT